MLHGVKPRSLTKRHKAVRRNLSKNRGGQWEDMGSGQSLWEKLKNQLNTKILYTIMLQFLWKYLVLITFEDFTKELLELIIILYCNHPFGSIILIQLA